MIGAPPLLSPRLSTTRGESKHNGKRSTTEHSRSVMEIKVYMLVIKELQVYFGSGHSVLSWGKFYPNWAHGKRMWEIRQLLDNQMLNVYGRSHAPGSIVGAIGEGSCHRARLAGLTEGDQAPTCSVVDSRSDYPVAMCYLISMEPSRRMSEEEAPTETANSPGSTTFCMSVLYREKASASS